VTSSGHDAASGDDIWRADFSGLKTPGEYRVVSGSESSEPFEIRDDVYSDCFDKCMNNNEAFDEIINNMPESETAFKIAKEGLISRLRTDRTVKEQVLWSFIRLRNLGLEEDRDKQIFEKVQAMTLADVKAAQEKWVKNRKYVYGILGDIQDLDLNYLKTLGPIRTVSQEEIFGY
jgi:hypothetical protein